MKTLLLTTDFSDNALNAGVYAMHLAAKTGAHLHILNVYHIPNPLQTLPLELIITPDELKADTDSQLKKEHKALMEFFPNTVPVTLASRNGHTEKEIAEYAAFIKADMIITGMQGKNPVAERLLGSTATGLMQTTHIPVLAVPEKFSVRPPLRIVYASDGKAIPRDNLTLMFSLIRSYGSQVDVVSILSPRDLVDPDVIAEGLEPLFKGIQHRFHFPAEPDVDEGILDFIRQDKADLLVVVPGKHNLVKRILSEGHSRKLTFHSPVPVLALSQD